MNKTNRMLVYLTTFVVGLGVVDASAVAQPSEPEITAQGFDISERQEGPLAEFQRLRVRFEVPGRIERLEIRERSYDVDLATTPEADHLPLFGLQRQVRQLSDVTLDFRNYIDQKLDAEGDYRFEITVADRSGQEVSSELLVRVIVPAKTELGREDSTLDSSAFTLIRVGPAEVSGAEAFGFSWKTVESNRVVIRLIATDQSSSHLFELPMDDYEALETREQLLLVSQQSNMLNTLDLVAAGNRAAGSVFGVVNNDVALVLKVRESRTTLSNLGTTVTLLGDYKF